MKKVYLIIIPFVSFLFAGCSSSNNKNSIEATGTIETVDVILSSKTSGEIKELKIL
jgi:uncharacterized protein YcfL